MQNIKSLQAICLALWIALTSSLTASEPTLQYAPLASDLVAVPQNLLGLSHAVEVQKEMKIDGSKLADWELTLREIDAVWWPSRIKPIAEQRKIIAAQEEKLLQSAERLAGKSAVDRLRQIELQSQSSRVLLRPEIVKHLRLDDQQNKKLAALFSETDQLAKDTAPDDTKKIQLFASAKQNEPKKAIAILTPAQTERLRLAFGAPLDTTKLERIYPIAPELIDSGHWTSQSASLKSLRGKVVLVHFYAFQCHNCVANFGHYKRWDETLKKKGVALVGIQTPETSAERDPEKVIGAAKKEGFEFPVLIDLENKNWDAWGNTMWPTVYVIDKNGYIRFWWQGELNWKGATMDEKIESIVDQLLKED